MKNSLLLRSSIIFKDSNLIDCIRQSCIDFEINKNEDEIKDFINESFSFLEKELPNEICIELFHAILTCFSLYSSNLVKEFEIFIKKSKFNANYIIITASLIYYLTYNKPQLLVPECQLFVNDALKEILSQNCEKRESQLKIFNHDISPLFKNDLILNLLLTTEQTQYFTTNIARYIFSENLRAINDKFNLFCDKKIELGLIKILPQTEISNNQIFEFIINKNFEIIRSMDENSFSLLESAIFNQIKYQKFDIVGISKDTILSFISIIFIYLDEFPNILLNDFHQYENLIIESIKQLENNKSAVLNSSIDYILTTRLIDFNYTILSSQTKLQIYNILTKQLINGQYNGNKMILLNSICLFTSFNDVEMINAFLNEYLNGLIHFILQNLTEIKENYGILKHSKLNLMHQNSQIINQILIEFLESEDLIHIIYIIENLCFNQPVISNSPEISEYLMKIIHYKINENNFDDDFLLIIEFIKKNDFIHVLLRINDLPIPFSVKNGFSINFSSIEENENIEKLVAFLLKDSNIEKNEKGLKKLFDLMMKDDEIRQSYLVYSLFSYPYESFKTASFAASFKNEIDLYKDNLIEIINHYFYFNAKETKFLSKGGFIFSSLPTSSYGQSIILKLFESIEKKADYYEAFIILKTISSSFPFLFNSLFEKVFNIVCEVMDNFERIFKEDNSEYYLRIVKTYYSSISFFFSVLQSPICIDQFIQLFFNNLSKLNIYQMFVFFTILNHLFTYRVIPPVFNVYLKRLNIIEKVSPLLNIKYYKNCSFLRAFKESVAIFLKNIYYNLSKLSNYEIIQIDEFLKKIDNPINYLYGYCLNKIPTSFVFWNYNDFYVNFEKVRGFAKDVDRKREFWLSYKHKYDLTPTQEVIDKCATFLKEIKTSEPLNDLPDIPSKISVKMVRYLVMEHANIYSWILKKESYSFIYDQKEKLFEVVNKLYEIQNQEDEESIEIDLFNSDGYLLPYYCHLDLFKNLLNKFEYAPEPYELHYLYFNLIKIIISENKTAYFSFLKLISEQFDLTCTDIERGELVYFFGPITNLINALLYFSEKKEFQSNFVDLCGNNFLNIILKPKIRKDSGLLHQTLNLFVTVKNNLPIRLTQVICFALKKDDTYLTSIFQLIKKFEYKDIGNVHHFINSIYENKIKEDELSRLFIEFLSVFPSLIDGKRGDLFKLLERLLNKYSTLNIKTEKIIHDISILFKLLSPKKENLTLSYDDKSSSILQQLKQKSKSKDFWNLYEKYSKDIIEIIENQIYLLDDFMFLDEYPELISFKLRSLFFRKKMKNKKNWSEKFNLKVDRQNILATSYESFLNKTKDQLLRRFNVVFNGEQSIDAGGPTREWFTILAKEIFNQKYGLFECSKNSKSYQPSAFSDINPNHIDYFKFVGKFIALALIHGQYINAHFTTSFYKQILKHELSIKDVEDVDDILYKNLVWMLNNDVDSLCMFFEVDTKEFGKLKAVPLKENGSEIRVTNENKEEFVNLRANYALKVSIDSQIKAFCEGFYSLIEFDDIKNLTPNELDLLICGISEIDVKDFINNIEIGYPYKSNTPVIKYFFNAISKWDNEKLEKLLLFMTGSSRVPINGFKEFCELTGSPLRIVKDGNRSRLPHSHTCFNTICLPKYKSEEELNEKLIFAIEECNTFEMS